MRGPGERPACQPRYCTADTSSRSRKKDDPPLVGHKFMAEWQLWRGAASNEPSPERVSEIVTGYAADADAVAST